MRGKSSKVLKFSPLQRDDGLCYSNREIPKLLPKNQIHIVLMEDLIEKRDETVKKMWGFLGIRDVEIEVLPHENRSVSARSFCL